MLRGENEIKCRWIEGDETRCYEERWDEVRWEDYNRLSWNNNGWDEYRFFEFILFELKWNDIDVIYRTYIWENNIHNSSNNNNYD